MCALVPVSRTFSPSNSGSITSLNPYPFWSREAERAFEWFLGRNDLGLPLHDSITGGCRDGLHSDRVNENQGAESSLAFYLSWAELHLDQYILTAVEEKIA